MGKNGKKSIKNNPGKNIDIISNFGNVSVLSLSKDYNGVTGVVHITGDNKKWHTHNEWLITEVVYFILLWLNNFNKNINIIISKKQLAQSWWLLRRYYEGICNVISIKSNRSTHEINWNYTN